MSRQIITLLLASAMLLSSCSCSSNGSHYSESSLDPVPSSEESSSEEPSSSSIISSSESESSESSESSSSSEEPVPQYFVVTFYANGGVFLDGTYYRSFDVLEGTIPEKPLDVTMKNYDFVEWVDSISGKSYPEFTDGVHANVNFQATWKQKSPIIFECLLDNTTFDAGAKTIDTYIYDKNVDTLDITDKFIISDDAHMMVNRDPDYDLSKIELPNCENTLTIQVYNATNTTDYTFTVTRKYNVTVYYYDENTIVHTEEVNVTDSFHSSYSYGKRGYNFLGWRDENGSDVPYSFPLIHDVNLYANMGPVIYWVTLDADGGEVSQDSITIGYHQTFTLPVPTLEGASFLGWWLDDEQITNELGQGLQPWDHTETLNYTFVAHYKMDISFNYYVDQQLVRTEYYKDQEFIALTGDLWQYTEQDYFRGWYGAQWWFSDDNQVATFEQAKNYFDEENNRVDLYGALYVDDYAVIEYADTLYSWCVVNYPDDCEMTTVVVPNTFNTERVAVIGSRYSDTYDHVFPATAETIWIPNLMYEFEKSAFKGLPNLITIGLSEPVPGEHNMQVNNEVLYIEWTEDEFYALTSCKQYYLKNFVAREHTRCISWYAFEYCVSLQTADVRGVEEIREGAFKDCTSLTSISLNKNTKTVESGAFEGCTNLSIVYFYGTSEEYNSIAISDTLLRNVSVMYL